MYDLSFASYISHLYLIQTYTTSHLIHQTLQPGDTRLKRTGVTGFFWKMSRIGERLSPYVGASCAIMAIHLLFFK